MKTFSSLAPRKKYLKKIKRRKLGKFGVFQAANYNKSFLDNSLIAALLKRGIEKKINLKRVEILLGTVTEQILKLRFY